MPIPWDVARCVVALFCLGPVASAFGSCFPPPAAELRALDRETDDRPARAAAEAVRRLALAATRSDPLLVAQLHAIAAEAEVQASRPEAVREHVDAGLKALASAPPVPERYDVSTHLQMADAVHLSLVGEFDAARKALDAIAAQVAPVSAARSCVLATRSLLRLQTGRLDAAAADGIESFDVAVEANDAYARMNAAYMLAAIYSRVGLMSQAEEMIAGVIEYADRERARHLQAISAFMQARVYAEQGKFAESLAAARRARELAIEDGAPMGIAAATVSVCIALVGTRAFDEADALCHGGEAELEKSQRADLLAELRAQQARIALARNRPRDAIRRLDTVLSADTAVLRRRYVARYHRYRAEAFGAIGDAARELADLRRAEALEENLGTREHVDAVAVIGAMNERVRWLANQRELQARVAGQQRELATQRALRNASIAFSAAALVLVGLLTFLLKQSRDQRQALRRQEAMLDTVVRNAPDALVLLDAEGRVRYASRSPFDSAAALDPGARLLDAVEGPAAPTLREVLDAVYERRRAATSIALVGESGTLARYFEVRGTPVLEDGSLVGVVVRTTDVTASQRLEREVVATSARERQTLSGEIHEGLGQQLAGIAMLAQSVLADVERGRPASRDALADITNYLAATVHASRDVARDLAPVAVERGSLGDALRRLAADVGAERGVRIDADAVADVVVHEEAADHLYRIVSEALRNASAGGGVARIALGLVRDADRLVVSVDDDGRDPRAERTAAGAEMRMIEYRARLLGGAAAIEQHAAGGTRVRVVVPWSRCARAA